jgi:hypothetical protein
MIFLDEFVVNQLGSGNFCGIVLSLTVVGSLLKVGASVSCTEVETIKTIIAMSLSQKEELVVLAGLELLPILRDSPKNYGEISEELMQSVVPLLSWEGAIIRQHAYSGLMSVCEMCDCEIAGLFDSIWSLQSSGLVGESDVGNYILVIAHIIELSKDISDDSIAVLVGFLDFIFSLDCVEKCGGLSIVSSIFQKRPSLLPELLPRVSDVLKESMNFANDDVQCQSLVFLGNLSKNFGVASLNFISESFERIGQLIDESQPGTRIYCASLRAGCTIIKFCEDDTLIPRVVKACCELIQSCHWDHRLVGCENIKLIGHQMGDVLEGLIEMIEKEEELEVLKVGIEAVGKVVKGQGDFGRAFSIIDNIIGGRIAFLGGSVNGLYESPPEFIESFLELVSIFLGSNPANSPEVISFLISWMEQSSGRVVCCILGSLIVGFRFCEIADEAISRCLIFIRNIIGEVESCELRQNISSFFVSVCEKSVSLVLEFIDTLEDWWRSGQAKVVGRRESNSNIGVALLRIFVGGGQVSRSIIEEIFLDFPPSDSSETNRMGTLMNEIVKEDSNGDFCKCFVFSVSEILIETAEQHRSRKLKGEVYCSLSSTFCKIVEGRGDLQGEIVERFLGNTEKQQRILSFFS